MQCEAPQAADLSTAAAAGREPPAKIEDFLHMAPFQLSVLIALLVLSVVNTLLVCVLGSCPAVLDLRRHVIGGLPKAGASLTAVLRRVVMAIRGAYAGLVSAWAAGSADPGSGAAGQDEPAGGVIVDRHRSGRRRVSRGADPLTTLHSSALVQCDLPQIRPGSSSEHRRPASSASSSGAVAGEQPPSIACAAADEVHLARAVFRLACQAVGPGEMVFVAGSHECLGQWAPKRALRMAADSCRTYWTAAVAVRLLAGEEEHIEYKFLIQHRDRSGIVRWEERSRNRVVTIAAGNASSVTSTWGGVQSTVTIKPRTSDYDETRSEYLELDEPECPEVTGTILDSDAGDAAKKEALASAFPRPDSGDDVSTWSDDASQSLDSKTVGSGENPSHPSQTTRGSSMSPVDSSQMLALDHSSMRKVSFAVTCCATRVGEAVFAVGGCGALGAWDPTRGVRLYTSTRTFPVWRSEAHVLLPYASNAGKSMEFKFVILREDRAGEARWEDCSNRVIPATEDLEVAIEAFWSFRHSTALLPSMRMRARHSFPHLPFSSKTSCASSRAGSDSGASAQTVPCNPPSSRARMYDGVRRRERHDDSLVKCAVPVVIVSSEVAPWSKTGGLGIVAASYAEEFPRLGHRTMVVSPKYAKYEGITCIGETRLVVNQRPELVKYWHRHVTREDGTGCDYVFVDHPCIEREGGLYADRHGAEYADNLLRFTLLAMAALEAPLILTVNGSRYGDRVCFISNDWHAGLLPVLLCRKYRSRGWYARARSLFVMHNLAYQGIFPKIDARTYFGADLHTALDLDSAGSVNMVKGALICADKVLTVSPTYAREIQTLPGGHGLHEFVQRKALASRLHGVCNGIADSWCPQKDVALASPYSADDFIIGKRANKVALQKRLGLHVDPGFVLLGFVGRLTFQKGVDIITNVMAWLMENYNQVQLVLLGSGDRRYADGVRHGSEMYAGRIAGVVDVEFDEDLERLLMAACDILVMPSRWEPCGLSQMCAQRYGTLPVASATGGLVDTVRDFAESAECASGFHIPLPVTAASLTEALRSAIDLRTKRPFLFERMQRTAMSRDFRWTSAMREYERIIDQAFDVPYEFQQ